MDFVYGKKEPWHKKIWNKIKYFLIKKPKKSLADIEHKKNWSKQSDDFHGKIYQLNE